MKPMKSSSQGKSFGRRHVVTWLALALLSGPVCAQAVELHYKAYMGAAEAGQIRVAVAVSGGEYSIQGEAVSLGLMEMLKAMRVQFAASGRTVAGGPMPERYRYHQRDNRKERLITVADGEVRYAKNGEQRPNESMKAGIDLVSALWMAPACENLVDVHTGRTQYRFSLVQGTGDQCRFAVASDDESFDVAIQYGMRGGLRVPVSIHSTGIFAGEILLIE